MDEDDLRFHLQKKSKRDLELFLEQNLPAHSVDPSARFCHTLILESHVRVFEADTIGSLHEIINDPLLSSPMIIEILNDWEPTWTPSLILVTREENMNSLHELERYANLAGEAAERIPRFPLAWAVESQSYSRYFDYAPESRAKAICRETVCDVTPVTSSDIERRLEPLAISSTGHLYETIQRLERDGLGESLANAFIQAVASSGNPSEHETGKARSAAEAFLFARLESLPETSSVFSLNEHLDIPFGSNASMEIDLLSREHRIAIEIDGYYHFQEAQSYRCDRRKDYLIQKNGFLVLRFLAEDIVTHLETILDTILESLIDRRKENSE